ncbi:TPA: ProQ/FINO family protein, partial [Salmonella enterica subsp. enterica serovar Saintpaul]
AESVKKSPIIVVKKKRQMTLTPVTENVPATPDSEKTGQTVNDAAGLKPQPHPSGLTKKQRKLIRHKQRKRQMRRENMANGRLRLPLFRQVFPLLWPEDNAFRLMKIGIIRDVGTFINENPDCGLSLHDCRCVFSWVTQRLSYLRLFTPGAIRYDLSGLPAGTVSDSEIFNASVAVERILRFQQQKAAETQQNADSGDADEKND